MSRKGLFLKWVFWVLFPGRRESKPPRLTVHQCYWGCCSAFASLSPTRQPDTTETVTLLIPNSSSTSPSQGPDPAGCPLELTASSPKLQRQIAAVSRTGSGIPGSWAARGSKDPRCPAAECCRSPSTRGHSPSTSPEKMGEERGHRAEEMPA